MTTTPSKLDFFFLGRKLGKYDSVDIEPESGVQLYGFEPNATCKLPSGDILIDLGRGKASRPAGPTGSAINDIDVLDAIKDCPTFTDSEWNAAEVAVREAEGEGDDLGSIEDLPSDK